MGGVLFGAMYERWEWFVYTVRTKFAKKTKIDRRLVLAVFIGFWTLVALMDFDFCSAPTPTAASRSVSRPIATPHPQITHLNSKPATVAAPKGGGISYEDADRLGAAKTRLADLLAKPNESSPSPSGASECTYATPPYSGPCGRHSVVENQPKPKLTELCEQVAQGKYSSDYTFEIPGRPGFWRVDTSFVSDGVLVCDTSNAENWRIVKFGPVVVTCDPKDPFSVLDRECQTKR